MASNLFDGISTRLIVHPLLYARTGTGWLSMLRTIFILLIRLFLILFFGTFEKTQLQIEHFLEHLAKWHCQCLP